MEVLHEWHTSWQKTMFQVQMVPINVTISVVQQAEWVNDHHLLIKGVRAYLWVIFKYQVTVVLLIEVFVDTWLRYRALELEYGLRTWYQVPGTPCVCVCVWC